jgi:hypothetical protein
VRPGIYDYSAADNLESALRTAANTLEGFITQRGQTAQHDFGYTVNGIIEGWIGNAYNKWCVDFNTSQNVLTNCVNNLNQLWVQVHNATYDAEMYMYNRASISQLPVPSPVGNPILAPQNSDPNNAEGATPAMLYDYSDLMTGLNDQILPTFRTSLPQYVSDYYASYSTTSNSAEPNLIQPIDLLYPDAAVPHSIAYYLTSTVRPMDAYVRTVGKAFEEADSNPVTTSPSNVPPSDRGDPDADHFITLSSEALLDQAIAKVDATDASIAQFTADEKAGAQAAKSFKDGGDLVTQQLLDELIANQNNAAWTSAFFSTLSTADILRIIQYINATSGGRVKYLQALAQAWTTALASGLLPPSSVQNLISAILRDPHQGISVELFNQYLLADLQKDAKAAANFLNYATDQQLQQLLDGNYSLPNANSSDKEALIIGLMDLTLRYEPDATSATEFYNRVWALLKTTQPRPAQPALKAAMQFFTTYLAFTVTPPGNEDLRTWSDNTAGSVWTLVQDWKNWIGTFEDANKAQTSNEQMWGELITGTAISVIFLAIGIGLTVSGAGILLSVGAAVGSTVVSDVASWAADKIIPLVDSGSGDGSTASDDQKLEQLAKYYTELSMVFELIAAGDVIGPNGPVDLSDSNTIIDVLNSVIPTVKNGKFIFITDEKKYHIKGQPGTTVADIVDHAGQLIPPP